MHGRNGVIVGAAFLVAPGLLCTCAHVVARALGTDARDPVPPPGPVRLDFPLVADEDAGDGPRAVRAVVAGWRPVRPDETGDMALLRIEGELPSGTATPWLVEADELWDDSVRLLGFPSGSDHGVWVAGRLRAVQGAGWLQMQSEAGPQVEPGFSGTPVWDVDLGGVVGMAVAAGRGSTIGTAYLHPASSILRAWPELAEHAQPSSPYRGLQPFAEEDEPVFCGREQETVRLEELLTRQSVVVLSGPSGSGKSSLVRAGLLPRLRRAGHVTAEFRPTPGLGPEEALAGAVQPLLDGELSLAELTERLAAGNTGEIAARLAARHPAGVVLFVDQFEEVVTTDPPVGRELFRLVTALADGSPRSRPVRALLTVRSGSLDRLLTHENRSGLQEGIMLLAPMDREQLRAAITGPLTAAPGVTHQAGLVERILDDAGDGPGRLPLVEFTLTRLWDRRRGGRLTHEAYDAMGGVSGAVAGYAEELYHRHLRDAEREAARRLLVQLARPEGDGGFARRTVRVDSLPEDQRRVATLLTDRKLLVSTQAVDGAEMVDVAHEALFRHWDRLLSWLAADRDFRDWQERLRQSLRQWQQLDGGSRGALLRGSVLAEALQWREQRPQEMTRDEHAFIQASLDRHRWEVRRWRLITAVITVLAVLAATMAGLTYQRSQDLTRQLRAQAARLLGQDAVRKAADSPSTAALLALTAWRTDSSQPEAYGALLSLYSQLRNTEYARDLPGTDHVLLFTATSDGRAAALVDQVGAVQVLTDLTGRMTVHRLPRIRSVTAHEPLLRLSPDGRKVGVLDDREGLSVWDVAHPDRPVRLPVPASWNAAENTADIDFSPDGSRVLALFSTDEDNSGDRLGLWSLKRRTLVSSTPLPAGRSYYTARFSQPSGTVVLKTTERYERFDLRTGTRLGKVSAVGLDGLGLDAQVVAGCPDDSLRVRPLTGRTPRYEIDGIHCDGITPLDASGRYAVMRAGDDGVQSMVAVDLRTGRVSRGMVPETDGAKEAGFLVLPRKDGKSTVLGFRGGTILRFTLPQPDDYPDLPTPRGGPIPLLTPDGRFRILADDDPGKGTLAVLDTRTGRRYEAGAAARQRLAPTYAALRQNAITSDGRHLVARSEDQLAVYSLPRLSLQHLLRLPGPATSRAQATGAVAAADDGSVLTLYAGILARWDPSTGRAIGSPLPLHTGDTSQQWLAANGEWLWPRPRHPEQVLVRGRDGEMSLWDLRARRPVGAFQANPDAISNWETEVFDPSGSTLATLSNIKTLDSARIEFRSVPDFRLRAPTVSAGRTDHLVGLTRDGHLISTGFGNLQLWQAGRTLEIAKLPVGLISAQWFLQGDDLVAVTTSGTLTLPLDPGVWYRELCRGFNRPLTAQERRLLPPGASTRTSCPKS
ncbi:trypsin-like peptidase domain-containing protein [Streptomyces cyanogenus]|uniref:nSTAND1 domain-containing NTPase n=1 Tax=Streptomyces cyanogenus TaxID=80860 RepID=UPI001AA184C9|nr:trypsin-like peptidase domain-containing protein [Streptomyces cyanogenus]